MLYKVVLVFESVNEIFKCHIQMKTTEQYVPEVLFLMVVQLLSL